MSVAARVAWAQLIVMGGGGGAVVEFDYSITAREESQARRLNTESVGARVLSMATARRMGTESVAPSLGTIAIGRRIRGEGL